MTLTCACCGRAREVRRERSDHCHPCAMLALNASLDDVAVERMLSHDPVRSTRAERQAAVQYLTERGYSADLISQRLGISERTVFRLRARMKVAA